MSNFCPNCGTSLEGAPKFCPSCGTALTPSEPAVPPQAFPQPQAPPAPQHGQAYYNAAPDFTPPHYPNQNMAPPSGYAAYGHAPYVPDESITEKFFRYDNRLNRKRYILRGLALLGLYLVTALLLGTLGMLINETFGTLLISLIGLAFMVPSVMLLIRRLHDLDRPGWWAIGNFIPILNIALSIYVLFIPGTPGPNQYGPDPLTVTN